MVHRDFFGKKCLAPKWISYGINIDFVHAGREGTNIYVEKIAENEFNLTVTILTFHTCR